MQIREKGEKYRVEAEMSVSRIRRKEGSRTKGRGSSQCNGKETRRKGLEHDFTIVA